MSTWKDGPRYPHDCRDCVFLGHAYGNDIYACPARMAHTERSPGALVARYGPEEHEYHLHLLAMGRAP